MTAFLQINPNHWSHHGFSLAKFIVNAELIMQKHTTAAKISPIGILLGRTDVTICWGWYRAASLIESLYIYTYIDGCIYSYVVLVFVHGHFDVFAVANLLLLSVAGVLCDLPMPCWRGMRRCRTMGIRKPNSTVQWLQWLVVSGWWFREENWLVVWWTSPPKDGRLTDIVGWVRQINANQKRQNHNSCRSWVKSAHGNRHRKIN